MFRRLAQIHEYLFRRRRVEDELDEELRAAFEIVVDRNIARGMPPEEARRAARIDFEGFETVKEGVRDRLAGSSIASFLGDMRYGWRNLWRRPSFAVVALLTLALGIGVNTAVFSIFHGVLLRKLPYTRPEQLVVVWAGLRTAGPTARAPVSGMILGEIARRNRAFSGVAGIWSLTHVVKGDEAEQVRAARVTTNFFDLLGITAGQGRTFMAQDAGRPAIVISDGLFRRRFGGGESGVGKGVRIDNGSPTMVGVLPPGFQLHFAPDFYIPAEVQVYETFGDWVWANRGEFYIRVVARMRPGVSLAEAQGDMERVAAEIRANHTEYGGQNLRLSVAPLQGDAVREAQAGLRALFAGAAFILLICCVNVTSLLLSRASDRRREIALRLSLGASRGRLVRQLLAEALVLCGCGGAVGVAAGWAGFRALAAIRPEQFARIDGLRLSWPAMAYGAAAAFIAALLFGLAPAFESFRLDLTETLRTSGRGWLGRWQRRAGAVLVAGEITLGFVLVTGAGLAARTLARIEQAHPGFDPTGVLTVQASPPGSLESMRLFEESLAALPGVAAVGAITHLPLDKDIPNWYGPYRPAGTEETQARTLVSDLRGVTPGYFAAMGIRLIEGRAFDRQDRAGARLVAVIDDLLAQTTWPGESPIGKTIEATHVTRNGFSRLPTVVVGVVEHVQNHSLTAPVRGVLYMPFDQTPRNPATFVLRATGPPLSLVPAFRAKLREQSRDAGVLKVRTMQSYVEREIAPVGFTAVLAIVFGALALLLAATGIYGVLNYQVSRRLPEMGIRMALGARARDVLRLVLREGVLLAGIGVVLGGAASLALARWLGSLVYGISPRDPLSYGLALLLLPAAALLGCWRPARRAAGANPAETIREE